MYYFIILDYIYFFERGSFKGDIKEKEKVKNITKEKEDPWIYCSACNNHVAKKKDIIEKDLRHTYSFLNPHGIYYNIRCFKKAAGTDLYGKPTEEFTWFPGYTWQVAVCIECKIHIGWKYESGTDSFFGLIENRISDISK